MKKLLFFSLLFVSITVYSQNEDKLIKDISKKYNEIENSIDKKKIKKQYFEYHCPDSNESGTVWFIFNKNELQKIEISTLLGQENNQTISYYFWKNELFFVFQESIAPQYIDDTKTIYHYTETRIYFNKEKPFRCIEKYYTNNPDDPNIIKSENIKSTETDCKDVDFIKEHLKAVQEYKDVKDEITLCIW